MNNKKFIGFSFGFTFLVISIIGSINYFVDPYGLNNFLKINKFNSNKYSNTNITTRYKSNILQKGGFNTIMLGTSRIGVMNPLVVEKYLKQRTFNLEIPGSTTEIQNKFFKYAYNFNDIKYLIYGIDFMAFNKNRITKNDFNEFYDLEEKIIKNKNIFNYDLYFNFETLIKSLKVVIKNILNIQKIEPTYLPNGMRDYQNYIDENQKGIFNIDYLISSSIKSYFIPNGVYKNYEFSSNYLEYFKDTIEFCKSNNIKVFVYIPPMYSDHFDALSSAGYYDEFELFKKELAKITDFIDFSGHNSISENKYNYWDSSHLRVEMTEVIMGEIFNNNSVDAQEKLGVFVTEKNINEHLQNLRYQIKDYDIDAIIKNPTIH